MHAAFGIQHGEFVGVVFGPGGQQGAHEGGFAAHAASGDEDGLPLPCDDSGVDEEMFFGAEGGEQFAVLGERGEQYGQLLGAGEQGRSAVEQVVGADAFAFRRIG